MVFLAFPIALIVLILRPILLIRFGPLRTERIGHLALNTEIYLCELDEEIDSSKTFDILYPSSIIANQQLMRMWKRKLNVCQEKRTGEDRRDGDQEKSWRYKIPKSLKESKSI